MGRRSKGTRRQRGTIDQLSNGALRVRVSAGLDPVTKQRHRLIEVVPPGPQALAEAERVRTRLLNEVDERRSPRTQATVEQLLDRYLDQHFDGEPSTKANYRRYARLHVLPFIGQVKVGQLDADALDTLNAETTAVLAGSRARQEQRVGDLGSRGYGRCSSSHRSPRAGGSPSRIR